MNYNGLLKLLYLENGSEFCDFDTFAGLIETNEYIEFDAINRLLNEANKAILLELTENYFEEISAALPDSETESYVFLGNVARNLISKLENSVSEYADEFYEFRKWYVFDSEVEIVDRKGNRRVESFFEALFAYRAEKLEKSEEQKYKFDEALDYELKEYSFNIKLEKDQYGQEDDVETDSSQLSFFEDGYITEDISDAGYEYRRGLEDEHADCCDCDHCRHE